MSGLRRRSQQSPTATGSAWFSISCRCEQSDQVISFIGVRYRHTIKLKKGLRGGVRRALIRSSCRAAWSCRENQFIKCGHADGRKRTTS